MPDDGEAIHALGRGVPAENRSVLQVANKAIVGAVEGEAEQETARAAHAFDRAAVRGKAQQIAGLGAAPDRTVAMDGNTFRMRDARVGEDAVEKYTRGRHVEQRLRHNFTFRSGWL